MWPLCHFAGIGIASPSQYPACSESSGGIALRLFGLALVLCGAVVLISVPGAARAFETEDGGDTLDAKSLLAPEHSLMLQEFKGHSLAMSPSEAGDSNNAFVSSYGNSIAIPMPGVSQPTPAWASSPRAFILH